MPGIVLALWWSVGPADSAPITVVVSADDGVSCSLDLYRPKGPAAVGVILLPDRPGGSGDWAAAAETLAARGCLVGCLDLRPLRAAESKPVWGRVEDPLAPWTQVWRDVTAARKRLSVEASGAALPWILGGAGIGAAVAAVAGSRLDQPPEALILLQPAAGLAGIPIPPILAGLELPVLLLGPTGSSEARDVATDAYLACRPRSTLWMTGGSLIHPALLFERRTQLAVDLAGWIVGQSGGRGGNGPAGPGRRSVEEGTP